jgi:DNA polymerase (family X)
LDIDWRWIPYCLEKGVMISINPDAHQLKGYHDMTYGINVARKGLLTKESCLNAMDLNTFEQYLLHRKQ